MRWQKVILSFDTQFNLKTHPEIIFMFVILVFVFSYLRFWGILRIVIFQKMVLNFFQQIIKTKGDLFRQAQRIVCHLEGLALTALRP